MPAGIPPRQGAIVYKGATYQQEWIDQITLDGMRIVAKEIAPNHAGEFTTDDQGSGVPQQSNAGKFSSTLSLEIHAESWRAYTDSHPYPMRSYGVFFFSCSPPGKASETYECEYFGIKKADKKYSSDPLYVSVELSIIGSPLENGNPVY